MTVNAQDPLCSLYGWLCRPCPVLQKPKSHTGNTPDGISQQQRLLAMQQQSGDPRRIPGLYLPAGIAGSSNGTVTGVGAGSSSALRVTLSLAKSSKSKLAYKKTYSGGPPLVPAFIVDRVLTYVQKLTIARKKEFLNSLCRYWSLKREARRGAPLLKRLHLEVSDWSTGPW